jgi:hypothetical protein
MSDTLNGQTIQAPNTTPADGPIRPKANDGTPDDPCCTAPPGGDPGPGQ